MSSTLRITARRALGLFALCFLLASNLPAQAQAVWGPGLQADLAALTPDARLTVIVTYAQEDPLQPTQLAALAHLGITQGEYFHSLPIIGIAATATQIQAVADLPGVLSIWPNEAISFFNRDSRDITGVESLRTDPDFRTAQGLPYSGNGIGVVVNDSGIDGLHDDVEYPSHVVQNVQGALDPSGVSGLLPVVYVENQAATDGDGHGTHVAGTVGGTGARSGGLYEGVAPGASLIGFGSGGQVLLNTLGGFDYALTHQFEYGIRIVTNSWGPLGGGTFSPSSPVSMATYLCYKRGILSTFAAGNDGPNADTHSPYGQAPWNISVAAGNKDGKTLADFSSRGKAGETGTFTMFDGTQWTYANAPDITAPGVDVISARANVDAAGAALAPVAGVPPAYALFYASKSGTSMATPHVAGIAALMLEADPQLGPLEIQAILKSTATPLKYDAWEAGAGYANAYAAVAAALGRDPSPYLNDGEEDPLPPGVMLVDNEGDADQPGTDILDASVSDDGTALLVTLRIADLDQATPSTMTALGYQVGAMQEYSVDFDLVKTGEPTVRYSLSAKRTLVDATPDNPALSHASYDYGAKASDGSGRGLGDLTGTWDDAEGVITWTAPFDVFNLAAPPADLTSDIDRSGRGAATGDVTKNFSAAVATSFWGGVVGLTPGATRYDNGAGTASYTLGEGTSARQASGRMALQEADTTPTRFELGQNYPNPFNPETTIRFSLPEAGRVTLAVYNVLGQRVRVLHQGALEAGVYTARWNGRDAGGNTVASGVYLYQLTTGDRAFTRQMLLMK